MSTTTTTAIAQRVAEKANAALEALAELELAVNETRITDTPIEGPRAIYTATLQVHLVRLHAERAMRGLPALPAPGQSLVVATNAHNPPPPNPNTRPAPSA